MLLSGFDPLEVGQSLILGFDLLIKKNSCLAEPHSAAVCMGKVVLLDLNMFKKSKVVKC